MSTRNGSNDLLIVDGALSGQTLIPAGTPLSRLNFYDGKFLKAEDYALEQRYLLELVRHSNQGLGGGVVHGFTAELIGGDRLRLGPGLAVEPSGQVILLPQEVTLNLGELIEASRRRVQPAANGNGQAITAGFGDCVEVVAPPPGTVLPPAELYVIAICRAEALCGQQDVYGTVCEDACVTSTARPYRREGLVVRALPLRLATPLPVSRAVTIDTAAHLRSRVAHAYFEDERRARPDQISSAGLHANVWCHGSIYDPACCEVPLAVIDRTGNVTTWLDAWIVRRERMTAPAKRYWQWQMRMRPWDVFLAQVLQFQCQLAHVLEHCARPEQEDPCQPQRDALAEAAKFIAGLDEQFMLRAREATDAQALLGLSFTKLADLRRSLEAALGQKQAGHGGKRILLHCGIVEVPAGGYLPVVPSATQSVNDQVRALLGDGLDYRFCVVRPDYVAHALEEVQHMDRIPLWEGIDDPTRKHKVDILVPDGRVVRKPTPLGARLFRARAAASSGQTGGLLARGTAREATLATGGHALYAGAAGASEGFMVRFPKTVAPKAVGVEPVETITADLTKSRFVKRDPTDTQKFEKTLRSKVTGAQAWLKTSLDERAKVAAETAPAPAAAARTRRVATLNAPLSYVNTLEVPSETVNGFWLSITVDKDVRTLERGDRTPAQVQICVGEFDEVPMAMIMTLRGSFVVTDVRAEPGNVRVLAGDFVGQASMDLVREMPEEDERYATHNRILLKAEVRLEAGEARHVTTVDLFGEERDGELHHQMRLIRSAAEVPLNVQYELHIRQRDENGEPRLAPLAAMDLIGDADVARPTNAWRRLAEDGLDILYAALDTIEPEFRSDALAKLYPQLPKPDEELTIQAVHDWVLFHRRREKHCTQDYVRPEVRPPRSYRVFNITQQSKQDALVVAADLQDPAKLPGWVKNLEGGPELIISYEGGTSRGLYDSAAAALDWERLKPADEIAFVVCGAVDEDEEDLQLARIDEFERTIRSRTPEAKDVQEIALTPLPPAAKPAGADGVMIFVTVPAAPAVECQTVIQVLAKFDQKGEPILSEWTALKEKIINAGTTQDVEDYLAEIGRADLGKVDFEGGTSNITPGGLDEVKEKLQGALVFHMMVWTSEQDDDRGRRKSQADSVRNALGGIVDANAQLDEVMSKVPVTGNCPSVLFVLVSHPNP